MLNQWDQKLVYLVTMFSVTKQSLTCSQCSAFAEYWKRKCLSMPATHGLGIQRHCPSPVSLSSITGWLGHMPLGKWQQQDCSLEKLHLPLKKSPPLSLSTLSLSTFQDRHWREHELLYTQRTCSKPSSTHTSHQELRGQESYLLLAGVTPVYYRFSVVTWKDWWGITWKLKKSLSWGLRGLWDAVASLPVCNLFHRCPSTPSKPWEVQMLDSPQDD